MHRLRAGWALLRKEGLTGLWRKLEERAARAPPIRYAEWVARYDTPAAADLEALRVRLPLLQRRPLFSVIAPGGSGPLAASLRAQVYPDWERCENLERARGEFVLFADPDDELPPHALFRLAEELEASPDAAVIYGDEDRLDVRRRRCDPCFKPDFSPDLLTSRDFIGRPAAWRRALVDGPASGDFDLALRISEKVAPARIRHVPAVLYHRRGLPADGPGPLEDHVRRRGLPATVEAGALPGLYRLRHALPDPAPLVSIIIPTRDGLPLLRACIESMRARTDYPAYEIVVVDNQSRNPRTLAFLDELAASGTTVLRHPEPFNYSAINNRAVLAAKGELLAFVNDDVEVIDGGWLREMASHALREEIGAVGARLLYPDGTVQHAGIVLGVGADGIAGAAFRGSPRDAAGSCKRALAVQNFSAVTAACLVMRKAVFEAAGGFDAANLAVAYNDVDLCLRLRERGYRILFTPHAELWHKESASRGSDLLPENRARFLAEAAWMRRRWGDTLREDPYYNPNLSLDAASFALADPPRTPRPGQPLHPASRAP